MTTGYNISPESLPIVERIVRQVQRKLKSITIGNGWNVDVIDVVRPRRMSDFDDIPPRDRLIVLVQDDPQREEEHDASNNLIGWYLPLDIVLYVIPSENHEYPIETLINIFRADVEKALMDDPHWTETEEDLESQSSSVQLAINTRFDDPIHFSREDGAFAGIIVRPIISYRTPEDDPYVVVG